MRAATIVLVSLAASGLAAACSSSEGEPPAAAPVADGGPSSLGDAAGLDDAGAGGDGAAPGDAGGDAKAPRYVDPCNLAAAVCTAAPAGYVAGSGLAPIDRCAYQLTESAGLGGPSALVDALAARTKRVTPADVVADANRDAVAAPAIPGAPPGVAIAFRWNAEDEASTRWIPQGLTGSPDADSSGLVGGKRVILSSFYDSATTGAKGVRVAFVDASATPPRYRFALLVSPSGTTAAPSFVPVDVHAGGLVWYGRWLYVADTTHGLRVFDTASILEVATDQDAVGCDATTCRAGLYKYVIPQVGKYEIASIDAACEPLFSFVSLDRSSSPPSLVSGEYCSASACKGPLAGRVFRWPLDPATGLLRSARTFPTEAFFMGQTQVQGGAARGGVFYLSSSAPAAGGGALYRVKQGASATSVWIDAPEDLMVDGPGGLLWCQSEAADARVVFGAKLTSYPSP